ncbi:CapA family protein [Proteus mirabilis]|uniref:CapA family protein n=1 Tax=Proteus mirabilis TaxID=584 RepID=UPI002574B37F|nr:CapA family protein [Proteus mirabilis]MDM3648398.1 CapA family protein [Proteus mirabilis]
MNLYFFGDICLQDIQESEIESIAKTLTKIKSKNDIFIANLECPITDSNIKIKKDGPNLRCKTNIAKKFLKKVPIDIYTLANNHILDYDKHGLEETLSILHDQNKKYTGAGLTESTADEPLIINDIGILSIAEEEFNCASTYGYGASSSDPICLYSRITHLKKLVNTIIVVIHGGNEFYSLPSPSYKKLLHYIIDIGADCIISHHPHVSSGMEKYNNKYIFYSIGNFLFPDSQLTSYEWCHGHGVKLTINQGNIDFSLLPYRQYDNTFPLTFLKDNELVLYNKKFYELTDIINNDKKLLLNWKKFTNKKEKFYINKLIIPNLLQKILNKFFKINFYDKKNINKKLSQLNLIRCSSHREALLYILENKNKKLED